eukprot:8297302-Pyramimonas_sp.AAC.1
MPALTGPMRLDEGISGDAMRPDARMAPLCIVGPPIRFASDSMPVQPDPTKCPSRSDFPIRCWPILPWGKGRDVG